MVSTLYASKVKMISSNFKPIRKPKEKHFLIHFTVRKSILQSENSFYGQKIHFTVRKFILWSENSFYSQKIHWNIKSPKKIILDCKDRSLEWRFRSENWRPPMWWIRQCPRSRRSLRRMIPEAPAHRVWVVLRQICQKTISVRHFSCLRFFKITFSHLSFHRS